MPGIRLPLSITACRGAIDFLSQQQTPQRPHGSPAAVRKIARANVVAIVLLCSQPLYIPEGPMQVARWGNGLAVRLPKAVAEALDLKEGDEIEIVIAGPRRFEIARDQSREQALARLKALKRSLPPGLQFERSDANGR